MRLPLWRRPALLTIALLLLTSGAAASLVPPVGGDHDALSCSVPKSGDESGHQHGTAVAQSAVAAAVTVSAPADAGGCDHCATTPCPVTGHCGGSSGVTASLASLESPLVVARAAIAVIARPVSFTAQPPTPPPHAIS